MRRHERCRRSARREWRPRRSSLATRRRRPWEYYVFETADCPDRPVRVRKQEENPRLSLVPLLRTSAARLRRLFPDRSLIPGLSVGRAAAISVSLFRRSGYTTYPDLLFFLAESGRRRLSHRTHLTCQNRLSL